MKGIKRALKVACSVAICGILIVGIGMAVLEAFFMLFQMFLPLTIALFAAIIAYLFAITFIVELLIKFLDDHTESEEKQ